MPPHLLAAPITEARVRIVDPRARRATHQLGVKPWQRWRVLATVHRRRETVLAAGAVGEVRRVVGAARAAHDALLWWKKHVFIQQLAFILTPTVAATTANL